MLALAVAAAYLARSVPGATVESLRAELWLTDQALGTLLSAFAGPFALGLPLGAWLARGERRRVRILALGLAVAGVVWKTKSRLPAEPAPAAQKKPAPMPATQRVTTRAQKPRASGASAVAAAVTTSPSARIRRRRRSPRASHAPAGRPSANGPAKAESSVPSAWSVSHSSDRRLSTVAPGPERARSAAVTASASAARPARDARPLEPSGEWVTAGQTNPRAWDGRDLRVGAQGTFLASQKPAGSARNAPR